MIRWRVLIIATIGLVMGAFATPLARADCTLPADGLVGHWTLDETSGSSIADSAGSNTGTWSDGVNNSVAEETGAGKIANALTFDGAGDDVTMGDVNAFDGGTALTVSAWVKSSGVGTPAGEVHFVDKSNCTGATNDGPFELYANDGVPGFALYKSGGSPNFYAILATTDIRDGAWHHLVGRYNGTAATIWVDGVQEGTVAAASVTMSSTAHAFEVGGTCNGSNYWWTGGIDDVRVYSRALSDTEIAALYATRSTAAAPAGFMIYDMRSAAMIYCNGTNWVHTGTGGYNPNAVMFDGTDILTHASALSNVAADGKTVTGSFWFRRTGGIGSQQRIYRTNDGDFEIRFLNTNQFAIQADDPSGTPEVLNVQSGAITDSNWHHVMFSFDMSSTSKRHLYIDGADALNVVTTYTDSPFEMTNPGRFGADGTGAQTLQADIADFWLDFETYVDLSVALNRSKFRSTAGVPMYLGPDGSIPTGSAPDIFLSGDTASWHTNKGGGGGFTVAQGALTTAASQPGDAIISNASQADAYCWGSDDSLQLGYGGTASNNTEPTTIVEGSHNWTQISTSGSEACAIDSQGDAWCWGDNSNTNLGTDVCCTNSQTPVQVVGGHKWTKISVGLVMACGVATDGEAYCWGNDDYQQQGESPSPGDGSPTVAVDESSVSGTSWTDVAAGDGIACGIRNDGTAWCWGGEYTDALGCAGACTENYIPVQVGGSPSGTAWTAIDVAYDYGCGIRDDDTAWCWGNDGSGQLGNGASGGGSTPSAVAGGLGFKMISAGNTHACGVTTTGVGYCWGSDTNGKLGNGASASATSPSAVTGGHTWSKIEAGYLHSCGLTTNGQVYCWGNDATGQVGNGSTTGDQVDPVLVNGGYTWADVSAAKTWQGEFSCGVLASGCTGPAGKEGQLTYNPDFNVMQYCNGAEWTAMGPVGGTPPTSGLVGHWKLDETSGTSAADSSGSALTGTMQGSMDAAADTVGGKLATALDFDGTNDRISLGTSNTLNLYNDFTVSAWINPRDMGESDGGIGYDIGTVFSRYTNGASGYMLLISDYSGGNRLGFYSEGTGDTIASNSGAITRNAWQHVAVVKQAASDTVTLYINGIVVGSGSNDVQSQTNAPAYIGAWPDAPGGVSTFDGAIDDLRVYNRALSAQEVSQLYHYGLSGGLGDVSGNCSSPSMPEGAMFYNIDHAVMQYCNGERWIGIGK